VHSLRSHLRPDGDRSGSHSDPSSYHSNGGSHSSRPSSHSQILSVRSEPSLEGRPDELGELRSPPLSAVRGTFGSSRPPSTQGAARPIDTYITPNSSRAPLLGGTVTSNTTTGTNTNSSVTTALTDPITGAIMHFPSLPWSRGHDPARRADSLDDTHDDHDHW
jgi:hypothetical protein